MKSSFHEVLFLLLDHGIGVGFRMTLQATTGPIHPQAISTIRTAEEASRSVRGIHDSMGTQNTMPEVEATGSADLHEHKLDFEDNEPAC